MRVSCVRCDNQGAVEEELLTFATAHLVAEPVLLAVAFVPLETSRSCEPLIDIHQENVYRSHILGKRPLLQAVRARSLNGLTPKAQSHSASPENMRGAPTGAQARDVRRSMDAECRLQRSLGYART